MLSKGGNKLLQYPYSLFFLRTEVQSNRVRLKAQSVLVKSCVALLSWQTAEPAAEKPSAKPKAKGKAKAKAKAAKDPDAGEKPASTKPKAKPKAKATAKAKAKAKASADKADVKGKRKPAAPVEGSEKEEEPEARIPLKERRQRQLWLSDTKWVFRVIEGQYYGCKNCRFLYYGCRSCQKEGFRGIRAAEYASTDEDYLWAISQLDETSEVNREPADNDDDEAPAAPPAKRKKNLKKKA